jgi:polyhydroxyalkanoate synthesis regulator phasin
MEQQKIAKQMLDFYKSTFDNTFNALSVVQEQTEKMVNMFLEQVPLMPEEGKTAVNEWVMAYKKGRTDFKSAIDESFKKVQSFFEMAEREGKSKGGK